MDFDLDFVLCSETESNGIMVSMLMKSNGKVTDFRAHSLISSTFKYTFVKLSVSVLVYICAYTCAYVLYCN